MIGLEQMPIDGLMSFTPSEVYPLPSVQKLEDSTIITLYPYTIVCKPKANVISVNVDPVVIDRIESAGGASILDDITVAIERMSDMYRHKPMNDEVFHLISIEIYNMHGHFLNASKDYDFAVRKSWSEKNDLQK